MAKNKPAVQTPAPVVQTTAPAEVTTVQAPALDPTPVPAAPAAPKPVILYTITAPKRPLTGTHFGVKGNAFTHAKLAEAATANGGTLTWEQIEALCKELNHKSFATYALKRLKVINVAPPPAPAPVAQA